MNMRLLMFFAFAVVSASNIGGSAHEARIMQGAATQQAQMIQAMNIQVGQSKAKQKKKQKRIVSSKTNRLIEGICKAVIAVVCIGVAIVVPLSLWAIGSFAGVWVAIPWALYTVITTPILWAYIFLPGIVGAGLAYSAYYDFVDADAAVPGAQVSVEVVV